MKQPLQYVCQHCHEVTRARCDVLNGSARLFCEKCNKTTQITLNTPLDYEVQERVRQANAKHINSPEKDATLEQPELSAGP